MSKSTVSNDPKWVLTSSGVSIIGKMKRYATYEEFLADKNKSSLAFVKDASGDITVSSGSAIYRVVGSSVIKLYEEEAKNAADIEKLSVVFVKEDLETELSENTEYFVSATLKAKLPATAKSGDRIRIVILAGGDLSTVTASEGKTIGENTSSMALNATDFEYRFVFDEESQNWILY